MLREIPIADCVHHCGFRYGRNEFNPYENYILGLSRGEDVNLLRDRFVDFLLHYRPKDVAQALGTATSKPIPLWLLPWKSWLKLIRPRGWQDSPDTLIDIMTHFSLKGIMRNKINKEFFWLERAWENINRLGYLPEKYGYLEVFELRTEKDSRYIVLDGNHRLSALYAMGENRVAVRQPPFARASRCRANFWPLVLSQHVSYRDALVIFDAYFSGNKHPHRSKFPAAIID